MKKILLIILCLLLTSCSTIDSSDHTLKKESTFLGTITNEQGEMNLLLNTEVYITTANFQYKSQLINKAKEIITKYHKLLDSHNYYLDDNNQRINNIKVLNDNIGKGPIKVDPIIIDALNQAIELTSLTQGYFNITLGLLSKLYEGKLLPFDSINIDPESDKIKESVNGIIKPEDLKKYIILDKENNTVELKYYDSKYEIDLGAFSKGYIVNIVYEELKKYNTSFLVTAGSSSIVAYKANDEDIFWSVGIVNPKKMDDYLAAFKMDNGVISSSGDYENYYFLQDNTRRHHILNPYTGYSENFYHSNTLLSSDAGIIDALSTALFNVKDKQERKTIINNVENYYNIRIDYCFVDNNYKIIMNKGFKDILIDNPSLDKIEIEE